MTALSLSKSALKLSIPDESLRPKAPLTAKHKVKNFNLFLNKGVEITRTLKTGQAKSFRVLPY